MLAGVTPEALVPKDRPVRHIKTMIVRALAQLPSTVDRLWVEMAIA